MKLTSKGRYAVTAMLDLALHARSGPVTLANISRRQGISQSYLEQLFTRLRKQGLVRSTRGPGGGYSLNQSAAEIAIADVVAAVNESVDATRCGGMSNCNAGHRCLTHDLWNELSDQIQLFLNRITLADLINKVELRQIARRQDARMQEEVRLDSVPSGS